MKITAARRSKIITETKFRWYDLGINPYVGCQHGCAYCYVRFLVTDTVPWGEFVRVRDYLKEKLPKEIKKVVNKRVCLGTATDPYQPVEKDLQLTRYVLESLKEASKVGVYTKSTMVLRDLDVFKNLTNPNLHMTITPIPEEIRVKIESHAESNAARFDVVRAFKEAGIKVRLNIAPMIPTMTDNMVDGLITSIIDSHADQFYVDPMQPYKQAMEEMSNRNVEGWSEASKIMLDKNSYTEWKKQQRDKWMTKWRKDGDPKIIAIWSDHEHKVSEDMMTGKSVDPKIELKLE